MLYPGVKIASILSRCDTNRSIGRRDYDVYYCLQKFADGQQKSADGQQKFADGQRGTTPYDFY